MKASLCFCLVVASCGAEPGPTSAPSAATEPESAPPEREREPEGTHAAETDVASELPPIEGPTNFVTPHHCHPPGPCTFEFENLRGAQHIDVGHGHASAPQMSVALRVREGEARLEALDVSPDHERRGVVAARPRDSLEGGAFYITLDGEASGVAVELSFAP